MMFSSENKRNSIRDVLFDAAVQLSVPAVASTASAASQMRSHSTTDESVSSSRAPSPASKSRFSLPFESTHASRHSDGIVSKVLRDVATQASPVPSTDDKAQQRRPSHLILDNNNNQTTMSSISATSKEYLSVPQHAEHRLSAPVTPLRRSRSFKMALLDMWQGLNSDELRSTASSPMDPKYVEDRLRLSAPSWKAFAKVVTSLLTFTRTKKGRYEWIQLVGHPGTFKEGLHDGYVLKELCAHEQRCCELLQDDILKSFVPRYNGTVKDDEGRSFIEMEDLLSSFREPCIMDCKIGVRTYLEEDLEKSERDPEPRADLYEKMILIDSGAPTAEENDGKKVLKPRYMIWRESLSSSQELGFRIEAIKKSRGLMSKEFQRIKERQSVRTQLSEFIGTSIPRATQYLQRLIHLRSICLLSPFFQTHELIGSSLLFVHDGTQASLWMIDFGKTRLLPADIHITHAKAWIRGSHEDGYLIGLDNLILLFQEIIDELKLSLVTH